MEGRNWGEEIRRRGGGRPREKYESGGGMEWRGRDDRPQRDPTLVTTGGGDWDWDDEGGLERASRAIGEGTG